MKKRLERLQEKLRGENVEALLVSHPANRRYLSGFDGSSGYLLAGEEAFLITDFRYREQAERQSPHCSVRDWREDLAKSLAPLLEEKGWRRIGFEKNHLTYGLYLALKEGLNAELIPLVGLVENLRMVKEDEEIRALREGAAQLDRAFTHILNYIRPGITERAVALELEFFLRRAGAEEPSFRYIVASGKRGAMPHGVASEKELAIGELVTMDFGAVFQGYATDITRTVALGEVDERQKEIYAIVREAQRKGAAGLKPGLTGREADAPARELIKEAGFGEYFGHGLGHGVGLETHELPVLSPRGETVLAPGMVVTVEPGIYIPGWGGVRIEDMLLVTESGAETLTNSARDLIII